MAKTTEQLLDDAIAVLRRGGVVTIDSVASEAGMSKAGVVHHFSSKEALMVGVVNRVMDLWEGQLAATIGEVTDPVERLRAYVDFEVLSDFDGGDLALLAECRAYASDDVAELAGKKRRCGSHDNLLSTLARD